MASQVEICNIALDFLGQRPILAMDEDSKSARVLSRLWDNTRDEVLRLHPWNFAVKRVLCSRLLAAPAFGYAYQYQKPNDCLRILQLGQYDEDDPKWEIEGDAILTDEDSCPIRYIRRVTETGLYDPLFVTTLAARLAYYGAYPITAQPGSIAAMKQLFEDALSTAKQIDGSESRVRVLDQDYWLDARDE